MLSGSEVLAPLEEIGFQGSLTEMYTVDSIRSWHFNQSLFTPLKSNLIRACTLQFTIRIALFKGKFQRKSGVAETTYNQIHLLHTNRFWKSQGLSDKQKKKEDLHESEMLVPDFKLMLAVALSVDNVHTLETGDQGSLDLGIVGGEVSTAVATAPEASSL